MSDWTQTPDIDDALRELGIQSSPHITESSVPSYGEANVPDTQKMGTYDPLEAQKWPGMESFEVPEKLNFFVRSAKNLLMGVQQGVAGEVETIDHLATLLDKATGIGKTDALKNIQTWISPTEQDLASGGASLYDKVVRSVGHAIPLIAQLMTGGGVVSAGLKAAKLPTAVKLGSKAVTQGARFLRPDQIRQATGLAAQARKGLKGVVPLAEPIAFGAYEAGHEAVRPGATLGSTLKRTGMGVGMGTMLPLARFLPQVARQAAAGGVGGLGTLMEGGTPEDALTSFITMATLASQPEIIKGGRAVGRLATGKKPIFPPKAPTIPEIRSPSEEAYGASAELLDTALEKAGYDRAVFQNWSPYQKQTIVAHTYNANVKSPKPLPLSYDAGTGNIKANLGPYSFDIPKINPKAPTATAAATEVPKGTIDQSSQIPDHKAMTRMTDIELRDLLTSNPSATTIAGAKMVLGSRQEMADRIVLEPITPDTPFKHVYRYIEKAFGGRTEITVDELMDMVTPKKEGGKGLIPSLEGLPAEQRGPVISRLIEEIATSKKGKGKITFRVEERVEPNLGDIEEALGMTQAAREDYDQQRAMGMSDAEIGITPIKLTPTTETGVGAVKTYKNKGLAQIALNKMIKAGTAKAGDYSIEKSGEEWVLRPLGQGLESLQPGGAPYKPETNAEKQVRLRRQAEETERRIKEGKEEEGEVPISSERGIRGVQEEAAVTPDKRRGSKKYIGGKGDIPDFKEKGLGDTAVVSETWAKMRERVEYEGQPEQGPVQMELRLFGGNIWRRIDGGEWEKAGNYKDIGEVRKTLHFNEYKRVRGEETVTGEGELGVGFLQPGGAPYKPTKAERRVKAAEEAKRRMEAQEPKVIITDMFDKPVQTKPRKEVEFVSDFPKDAREAEALGNKIRQRDWTDKSENVLPGAPIEIITLAREYIQTYEDWNKLSKEEKLTREVKERMMKNQLKREIVEGFLGKKEALTLDQLHEFFDPLFEERAKTIEEVVKEEVPSGDQRVNFHPKDIADVGASKVIDLQRVKSKQAVLTGDIERRAGLISKIKELQKEGEISNPWNEGALRDLDDRSLEAIATYKIDPKWDVRVPKDNYGNTVPWEKIDRFKARLPGKPIELEPVSNLQGPERIAAVERNVEKIKNKLSTHFHMHVSEIMSIDWEKVLVELKEKGVKELDTYTPDTKYDIKTYAFGSKELDKAMGVGEGEESVPSRTESQILARATGWTGLDPALLIGPMLRFVLTGRGMDFHEVVDRLNSGRPIPAPTSKMMEMGIYKGYSPKKGKGAVPSDIIRDWYTNILTRTAETDVLKDSYPRETEERLILESLPGIRGEEITDPAVRGILAKLEKDVLSNFRKYRNVGYSEDAKKNKIITDTFQKAATDAFINAWNGIKSRSTDIKEKVYKAIGEVSNPESEYGQDVELVGLEGMAEQGLEKVDFLQPGGPPYKPSDKSATEKVEEVAKVADKMGIKTLKPATEGDVLVNGANKMSEAYRTYSDVVSLLSKNVVELEGIGKEINKIVIDRDALGAENPATKQAYDDKIGMLRDRRNQLLTDVEYLRGLKEFFARTGRPFTGTETYLEGNLTMEEHGVDGSIISKSPAKGQASFYIVTGPMGGPAQLGQVGHRIFAKVDVNFARTKGQITNWEMPKGVDYRMEDTLYNSILERFMWRQNPIEITPMSESAQAVAKRRPSGKYKVFERWVPFWQTMPEDSQYYKEAKKKVHDELVAAATAAEGTTLRKYSRADKTEMLRRAQMLGDAQIGYDLEKLGAGGRELGFGDPTFDYNQVQYMPLLDRIGDPTQSRIAPVAFVGNLAEQSQLSIANYMRQYVDMAEQYLGEYKNDPIMKSKIFRHLLTEQDTDLRTKHPDWVSSDPKVKAAVAGYRFIMEDLAQLFGLKEKGLYLPNYATLSYDMETLWDGNPAYPKSGYRKAFGAASEPSKLPDSILSHFDPAHWKFLKDYSTKEWKQLDDVAKAFIEVNLFKNNIGYNAWETMPEEVRARVPKQKFIRYFQHRTGDVLEGLANEDIWDVLMTYIPVVINDGVMSDFFLPKAKSVVNNLPAVGIGETYSVRGFLDNYIKQVSGFGRTSPATKFMDSLFKTMNTWIGKDVFPESGMLAEGANMYQQWLYRGALGVDTAVRNLTQSIYTIAELGPYNWVRGLKGYIEGMAKQTDEYKKFAHRQSLVEEFFEQSLNITRKSNPTLYEKWKDLDRRVTSLALSPMRITEHINRGIAYFAGLAEAKDLGLDFSKAHFVGLRRAGTYAHPYEMTEAEWSSMRKMYKTQFGYGKVHLPPWMAGPAMSYFKPFLTFPSRSLQFWSNLGKESLGIERWGEAIGKGAGEVWTLSDKGQMSRFLALTGFLAFAPQLLAATLGIDTGYLWGKGLFPNNFTPLWMGMMEDFYTGVLGGIGMNVPPSEKDKMAARRRLGNSSLMMMIPQWRFIRKSKNVMENIENGYHAMGPAELPAYETTFAKEMLNLFGFPPDSKSAKQLVWDAYRERGTVSILKQDALKEAAKKYEKNNYQGASEIINDFYKKYRVRISIADVRDFIRRQQNTTAYDEAAKHILSEQRPEWRSKLAEAQKRYLPRGAGKRTMWTNNQRTLPSEKPYVAPTPWGDTFADEEMDPTQQILNMVQQIQQIDQGTGF